MNGFKVGDHVTFLDGTIPSEFEGSFGVVSEHPRKMKGTRLYQCVLFIGEYGQDVPFWIPVDAMKKVN